MRFSPRLITIATSIVLIAGCAPETATLSFRASASATAKSLQTPQEFAVVVLHAEMLRGTDDANPGVIFDAISTPVSGPAIVDLTETDIEIWSGEVPAAYFGTYTHVRATIAAAGQTITFTDEVGVDQTASYVEFYQDVDNSAGTYTDLPSGTIQSGDVLIWDGGLKWFEIDETATYSASATRTDVTPYQDANPNDAIQTIAIEQEFTITSNGDHTLVANFNITDTFEYVDIDTDSAFEPLSDDHDGTMNGFTCAIHIPAVSIVPQ